MFGLSDERLLQVLFIVVPFLSLIGSWLSLRTYSRIQEKKILKSKAVEVDKH